MVSTGDTEISLHIRSPRFRAYWRVQFWWRGEYYSGVRNWKYSKCQDLPKFQFSGGRGALQSENCQRVHREGLLWRIWTQIDLLCVVTVQKPACASQIGSCSCGRMPASIHHEWQLLGLNIGDSMEISNLYFFILHSMFYWLRSPKLSMFIEINK